MASSEVKTPSIDEAQALLHDIASLSRGELRARYQSEARSHANTKQRCKKLGHKFAPEWDDFRDFLRDMGAKPTPKHTLDRRDPDLHAYGPGLCRWADKLEQTRNRSNTRYVELEGERRTLQQFADMLSVPYNTIHSALSRGETPDEIAARYLCRGSDYCPVRYLSDPSGFDSWKQRHRAWRMKLQKDRQAFATAEVYDLTTLALGFSEAAEWLAARGYFDLAPEEEVEAAALIGSSSGHLWCHARSWMEAALEALLSANPSLAKRVLSRGNDYRSFIRFRVWLDQPSKSGAKRDVWAEAGL